MVPKNEQSELGQGQECAAMLMKTSYHQSPHPELPIYRVWGVRHSFQGVFTRGHAGEPHRDCSDPLVRYCSERGLNEGASFLERGQGTKKGYQNCTVQARGRHRSQEQADSDSVSLHTVLRGLLNATNKESARRRVVRFVNGDVRLLSGKGPPAPLSLHPGHSSNSCCKSPGKQLPTVSPTGHQQITLSSEQHLQASRPC